MNTRSATPCEAGLSSDAEVITRVLAARAIVGTVAINRRCRRESASVERCDGVNFGAPAAKPLNPQLALCTQPLRSLAVARPTWHENTTHLDLSRAHVSHSYDKSAVVRPLCCCTEPKSATAFRAGPSPTRALARSRNATLMCRLLTSGAFRNQQAPVTGLLEPVFRSTSAAKCPSVVLYQRLSKPPLIA